jgi:hypothetical protein
LRRASLPQRSGSARRTSPSKSFSRSNRAK